MNDQELANAIVALGSPFPELASAVLGNQISPYTFVRDSRVAMAMMEKMDRGSIVNCSDADLVGKWSAMMNGKQAMGESLLRAINKACAEALSNGNN